jgi:hypothetical protein
MEFCFLYTGHIDIKVVPCTAKGGELGEDDFVDDPKELVSFCVPLIEQMYFIYRY